MTRAIRLSLTISTLSVMLFAAAASAHAAAKPSGVQPGAGCSSTSSAIQEYCEDIPTATGRSLPPPGTPGPAAPSLGTALPPTAAYTYDHLSVAARKRAKKLLSLPAPTSSVPVTASVAVHKSAWSLPTGVILALVAIAAAGLAAAIARRRRSAE